MKKTVKEKMPILILLAMLLALPASFALTSPLLNTENMENRKFAECQPEESEWHRTDPGGLLHPWCSDRGTGRTDQLVDYLKQNTDVRVVYAKQTEIDQKSEDYKLW